MGAVGSSDSIVLGESVGSSDFSATGESVAVAAFPLVAAEFFADCDAVALIEIAPSLALGVMVYGVEFPAALRFFVAETDDGKALSIRGDERLGVDETRMALLGSLEGRTDIVTYCHKGVRSLKALELLKGAGLSKLRSVRGGIDAWSRAVDPDVPRY